MSRKSLISGDLKFALTYEVITFRHKTGLEDDYRMILFDTHDIDYNVILISNRCLDLASDESCIGKN